MTFTHLTYRLLLAIAPLVLLTGCADDLLALQDKEQDTVDSEPGVWVSIKIDLPRETRANPTNEWGDGQEPGVWKENIINDINIFLFHDSDGQDGLDSPGTTKIESQRHFLVTEKDAIGNPTDTIEHPEGIYADKSYEYTYKVKVEDMPKDGDFAVVIANYGDSITGVETLADLTGLHADHSWIPGADVTENSGFLMSNAYNNQYDKKYNRITVTPEGATNNGTREYPFRAQVYLQRSAARIDLLHDEENERTSSETFINAGNLRYDVNDSNDAIVELTHIQPINVRQSYTYVLKHLTDGFKDLGETKHTITTDSPRKICSKEELEGGIPSNYVIDAMTPTKHQDLSMRTLARKKYYYGATARHLFVRPQDADTTVWDKAKFTASNAVGTYIGAHEKMSTSDGHDYATVLTYAEENTQSKDIDDMEKFATGLLLRAVYHPETVYTSADRSTSVSGHKYDGDFVRYMPTTKGEQTDDKAYYFSSKRIAEEYSKANLQDAAIISDVFKGGVCYYNVWIRHANAEGNRYDRPIPMEFGIVRNNLYRLSFTFSGPGTPDVEIREPYNVHPRIFVRPWNVRVQPEIIL